MTRIFLTTSPINCVFYLIYLRQHEIRDVQDVLIIDSGAQTETTINFIHALVAQYPWFQILDFSTPLPGGFKKPSFRKRLTRQLRNTVLVKPVYQLLLSAYQKSQNQKYTQKISSRLLEKITADSVKTLFLNTKTQLNPVLISLFKSTEVMYMEHGMGDYFLIDQDKELPVRFSCLFDDAFRTYLGKQHRAEILPFYNEQYFQETVAYYLDKHPAAAEIAAIPHATKKNLLILLQNVEFYGADPQIHLTFLDSVFAEIDSPEAYFFIFKPHPRQSAEVIAYIKNYLASKNIAHCILDSEALKVINIEIIFALWQQQVTAVFTMFSSALFYLSKLFPSNGISYYYNYEILRREIDSFAPDFRQEYIACEALIREVFSENCIEMNS
jgi:hypothetical protein